MSEPETPLHTQLWAPWRLAYVKADPPADPAEPRAITLLPGGDRECFLCRAVADTADRENLVAGRGEHTVCVLNRYPYNNGHLLIAPKLHKARLADLSSAEQLECVEQVADYVARLERLMAAQGFNVGLNLGRVAGAGLPGHLHWHVVPRWQGDTNFMPSLAGVRVIPQALEALWEALQGAE
ncbi:MAG: HIT domain-containing protein [Pirellulales bacterium]